MAKTNRICKTCGKAYYYCPTCDFERRPNWFAMWDSEKCKDIFMLLSKESAKHISTEDTYKQLIDMNVSLKDNFTDSVKKHITRVFEIETVDKIKVVNTEKVVNDLDINATEQLENVTVLKTTKSEILIDDQIVSNISKKRRKKKISEEID